MASQRVKNNKKYETSGLLQYTHTENSYLFVLYNKNSNGLLKDFRGMKKEKQVR